MSERSSSVRMIVATLLAFALVAIPLAGLSWDMLSDLISGHLAARKAAYGTAALVLLLIVLRYAMSAFVRLDARLATTSSSAESQHNSPSTDNT